MKDDSVFGAAELHDSDFHSYSDSNSIEDEEEAEEDIGSSIASLLFNFLADPSSSRAAMAWSVFTCVLVLARMVEIGVQSCDGPNQYYRRPEDLATYRFLLTEPEYFKVYIAIMCPLIVDGFARIVFLLLISIESENHPIYEEFKEDPLEVFLFCTDIVGLIPFFTYAGYYYPKDQNPSRVLDVILNVMELMLNGRILRSVKKIPAIRAITIALRNAAPQLALPTFFFFVFNITTGVFFYFSQPCYNLTNCPWATLFDSTFFSIVTMTTTGYGNQVPPYELARFVACCVMLFGALFLSMPLAIIGNEYDRAWNQVLEEKQQLQAPSIPLPLATKEEDTTATPTSPESGSQAVDRPKSAEKGVPEVAISFEEKKEVLKLQPVLIAMDHVHGRLEQLHNDYINHRHHIPHSSVLSLCEMKAWLPTLGMSIQQILTLISTLTSQDFLNTMTDLVLENANYVQQQQQQQQQQGAGRRLSVFGGRGPISSDYTGPLQPSVAVGGSGNGGLAQSLVANPRRGSVFGAGGMAARPTTFINRAAVAPAPMPPATIVRKPLAAIVDDESEESDSNASAPSSGGQDDEKMNMEDYNEGSEDYELSDDSDEEQILKPSQMITQKAQRHPSTEQVGSVTMNRDSKERVNVVLPEEIVKDDHGIEKVETREATLASNGSTAAEDGGPSLGRKARTVSIYVRLLEVIGVQDEAAKTRTITEDFVERMERVSKNPNSLRSRIWIFLELPSSSREARAVQYILIFLISVSIFSLFTQTVLNLSLYGESTSICSKLLSIYCDDKFDPRLDPGCYVQTSDGITTNTTLHFDCTDDECFGHGYNFGSLTTNMTCSSELPPFQNMDQLYYMYGVPTLFFSRDKMHHANPICSRIECTDNASEYFNAQPYWLFVEFFVNIFFSIELVLRLAVADSLYLYWKDKMNFFDILAIFPFYSEIVAASTSPHGFSSINFSILASTPEPLFLVYVRSLKVFRLFKLTRHFRASKVLTETAHRIWKQILGMLMLLFFLVFLFAIIMFVLERGDACYVGDPDCIIPADVSYLQKGEIVYIAKNGQLSTIPNVFYGVWFSFVTVTTTGYGDIVPVTEAGQLVAVFLMIAGQFYLAMPLTAAATTFYAIHEQYTEDNQVVMQATKPESEAASSTTQPSAIGAALQPQAPVSVNTPVIINPRMQMSIRHLLHLLQQHEKTLVHIVSDIQALPFSLFDVDRLREQKRGGSKDENSLSHQVAKLRKRIALLCKDLEECLQSGERDVVELLFNYDGLLKGKALSKR